MKSNKKKTVGKKGGQKLTVLRINKTQKPTQTVTVKKVTSSDKSRTDIKKIFSFNLFNKKIDTFYFNYISHLIYNDKISNK